MAADPKAAPLAEDFKEFAISLPSTVFPRNFFCALCSQLALDSYKLLCCNKAICSDCQVKLTFPTTCPSCDHSPLEADSCVPNKALRNTMRVWLQKQKKKEEKAAIAVPTFPAVVTPATPEVPQAGHVSEKPADSVETAQTGDIDAENAGADDTGNADQRTESAVVTKEEGSVAPPKESSERRGSTASQTVPKDVDATATQGQDEDQKNESSADGNMMGNNPMMMNNMSGQMGFGIPNQAGFNGMGFGMNGMPNMLNGNWNGMNQMDFNAMNGMFNNFGGNMGMGMNDMSAMNFGGGIGGWNGMGGGYGNFNGFNQMGGYNQSGAYANQYPKNNFPNQNQNRFHANQGGTFHQRNMRNGSQGVSGPGAQTSNSRPGSQNGSAPNRDGQSPVGTTNPASEAKASNDQVEIFTESTEEGKASKDDTKLSADQAGLQDGAASGDAAEEGDDSTNRVETTAKDTNQSSGLNQIQSFDSGDADMQGYDQSMMGNGMQNMSGYGMTNNFDATQQFDSSMGMGYNNNFGSHNGFNNGGAYGAAKILTEQPVQPIGVGVVGAPTGPRAMREGRPNTGFQSRASVQARFSQPVKTVTPAHEQSASSPHRRVRSKSPMRDESLRVQQRSPTRSRSRSPQRDDRREEHRSRPQSVERQSTRDDRGRSRTQERDDHGRRADRRQHRSSRYDDREDYDDRHREDKDSRGSRTRDASEESRYRSIRHEKDKSRSSRSHRDRSKDHRRYRSRSPAEEKYNDDAEYTNGEKESDGSSRRRHRNAKDKPRDRSRDRERDRKDRKERDRDYEYERSRDKEKDRKRRRDREAEEDERDHDDDKHRSSRRSRRDREHDRSSRHDERDRDERDRRDERQERQERASRVEKEEDVVGNLMKKRATSPPLNAPTGPSANGFSIKGRSKAAMPPPSAAPSSGPRALQPPKGPAADRDNSRSESKGHHGRKPSTTSATASSPKETSQDHYAAERARNARERDSRDRNDKSARDPAAKSLHSRIHTSSRPSLSSKRSRDAVDNHNDTIEPPRGPRADAKPPTGPAGHRDKRRKSGAGGDDTIANLFTAGLRKNAKRRGGVRIEGDIEREMERLERGGR